MDKEISPFQQLDEKMTPDLKNNQPYEALQYIQSYLARKKKLLGQNKTSELVFYGAKLMINNSASSSAGTLIAWFIEDGAGVDYQFKLQMNPLDGTNYCDIERLTQLLQSLSPEQALPIVEAIYSPLHILLSKKKGSESKAFNTRISTLELLLANIFEQTKKWVYAYKSYLRIGDIDKLCVIGNQWAADGYITEKPLFFARNLIYLLSENKVIEAYALLQKSSPFIDDNIKATPPVGGGPLSASLAVWHLSTILTELAFLPPMQRVDKSKLFGILLQQYQPLVIQMDAKLLELLFKAGEVVFSYQSPQSKYANSVNPMAMLQGLLGGGAGNASAPKPVSERSPSKMESKKDAKPSLPELEQMINLMSKFNGK